MTSRRSQDQSGYRDFKHPNLDFQVIKDASGKRKLKICAWLGYLKNTAATRTALGHVDTDTRYKVRCSLLFFFLFCFQFVLNSTNNRRIRLSGFRLSCLNLHCRIKKSLEMPEVYVVSSFGFVVFALLLV